MGLKLVDARSLDRIFQPFRKDINCILLNACNSSRHAEALSQYGFCVIGSSRKVMDESAINFAEAFYDQLASGAPYLKAFRYACNAVPEEADFRELWYNGHRVEG